MQEKIVSEAEKEHKQMPRNNVLQRNEYSAALEWRMQRK